MSKVAPSPSAAHTAVPDSTTAGDARSAAIAALPAAFGCPRQIWPPGAGCSSTTATRAPAPHAAHAAAIPAGPAPTTATSASSFAT